jgi:hypothetical protein
MTHIIQETMTPSIIASTIRLQRGAFSGAFLLLEGVNDQKLFSKFIDENLCRILVGNGKEKVLELIELLEKDDPNDYLAIVDRDFADLLDKPDKPDSVFYPDDNDIEISLFESAALDQILIEYGSSGKLERYCEGGSLKELIYVEASQIGAIRFLSKKNDWNLKFENMKFRFLPKKKGKVDLKKQTEHIISRSRKNNVLDVERVLHNVAEARSSHHPKDLSNGHDVLQILAVWLKNCIGNCNAFSGEDGLSSLHSVFRLSYTFEDFKRTSLFSEIDRWQKNRERKIFALQ